MIAHIIFEVMLMILGFIGMFEGWRMLHTKKDDVTSASCMSEIHVEIHRIIAIFYSLGGAFVFWGTLAHLIREITLGVLGQLDISDSKAVGVGVILYLIGSSMSARHLRKELIDEKLYVKMEGKCLTN